MDEHQLISGCLEHLNKLPGLEAQVKFTDSGRHKVLTLSRALEQVQYVCEVKTQVTQAMLGPILDALCHRRKATQERPLLMTQYLPGRVMDHLMQEGFECIDAAGNMYLNSPAAYVWVQGKRPQQPPPKKRSIFSLTCLKLIYVILVQPTVLGETYRTLAKISGISLGAVSAAIQALYDSGYLQRQKGGEYRLTNYQKLLSIWELGYVEKLRPKLVVGTYTMTGLEQISDIADQLRSKSKSGDLLMGGELGAAISTQYLRPQRATLHMADDIRTLIVQLRLRPDPTGNITVLKQFGQWNAGDKSHLASPLLLRAELLVEPDERLRETAALLKESLPAEDAHANRS